ncbi:MAG: ATP synthase F1 subunit delta [Candidatus Omnitrophota bacterium]|nr:ATP synthase F1 subunit delta [Candidatus Omnitrophota bacterium]
MTLIKRYAEGFLEYAKETIGSQRAMEEMKAAKDVFRDNPEFKEFLENPAINYIEKCGVIDRTLATSFSQEMRNFLKLLLKKSRIDKFSEIAEYVRIKYAHGEKSSALLYTSYLMGTEFLEKFKNALENKLRVKLQLYVNLAPDMLGGVRVIFGNKILDGSVRKRLEDVKRKLLAAKVA